MGWPLYFSLAGSEIINSARTEAYASGASWFTPVYNSNALAVLEGVTYDSPWVDPAPWGDPDNPDTYRFWGAYPLNITGLEDSTRTAQVTENIGDGGVIGPVRLDVKSIVFEVLLIGEDECAVDAGLRWLSVALSEAPCSDGGCNGAELCYFSCEPCLPETCTEAEREECATDLLRIRRSVKITSGPTVTAKRTATDGGAIWVVTFTATAGVPYEFGSEVSLVQGFMVEADPWVPEIVPGDWSLSVVGTEHVDEDCALPAYEPIIDPLCPAVLVPPGPPSVSLGCFTPPEAWERRWFTVPRKYVPYWGTIVPVVKVQAIEEVRNLRLRFYADLNADASVVDDPCAYCGDILFSYIPPDHTLVFDGITQTVYAEGPGGTLRRADSLVFKTDGTPFEWPLLSCGLGYVVAVDLPEDYTNALPAVDFSIAGRG